MRHATRRDALMLIATAASLPTAAPAFAAAKDSGLVPRTPMDVYAKIRCSLRDEPVPFWYRGHAMIALQDDIPRPFLGVEGFSYTRFSRDADGAWLTRLVEVGYFTDLATGAIVDEARNPLTGATIRPQHFRSPVQVFTVRADGGMTSPRKMSPSSEFIGRVWPPQSQGPETWVDEDAVARISSDTLPPGLHDGGPVRMLTLGALTTYRAHSADVNDPALASAPCTFHLQELASLPPWFGLGAAVGKQMWRLSGRKLASIAEIPAALRARIDRDHPGFVAKPEA